MADDVGQQLGNYQLICLLGQGGFADVYLGEHVYLKTLTAIKLLQTHLVNEDFEAFLNEARTIASLTHPHIVRVLDFGIENDTPFLVMEYAPNGTLRQHHPKGCRDGMEEVEFLQRFLSKRGFDFFPGIHDAPALHRLFRGELYPADDDTWAPV